MKKGKVLSFKGCNRLVGFIIENNLLIILSLFFIAGLCFGVFTFDKYDFLKEFSGGYIEDFINSRTDYSFLHITFSSFFDSLLFVLVVFAFGASLLGIVFVPLAVCFKGYIFGCIAALLYSEYALKGVAFHAVIILPASIVFLIAFILCALESVRFSLILAKLTFPTCVPQNLSYVFKNYCSRYLLYCLIILFSALIDALISTNFLNRFSL